jgi:predicted SAM-dependent methyltransferase
MSWDGASLHLGCGGKRLAGCVNVDAVAGPGVDAVLDVTRDLGSLPDNALAWVYSSHVIEHIAPDLLPGVFAHLHRALRPGGVLTLATIDLDGIYHRAYSKGYSAHDWNAYLYGDTKSTDSPWMAHKQCFTAATLTALLRAAGFAQVRPWALAAYPAVAALNDCAASSWHVTLYLEGVK